MKYLRNVIVLRPADLENVKGINKQFIPRFTYFDIVLL